MPELREGTQSVLWDVYDERVRQIEKWGEQHHRSPETMLRILVEEVGEAAQEINDGHGHPSPNYRTELVQVAAVAVAAVEAYDKASPEARREQVSSPFIRDLAQEVGFSCDGTGFLQPAPESA